MQLKESEHSKYYFTLELFAFRRYKDYISNPSKYIDLSEVQLKKLRQLTFASLASESNKRLSFNYLMQELSLPSHRHIVEMAIECISNGLIFAKIDQKNEVIIISDFFSRDIPLQDVNKIINKLFAWLN